MAAHDKTEPVYMIGVVANLTQMHAQTIRLYERLGLVTPLRKNKNQLYLETDVERLRPVWRLKPDIGGNLAGVEVILDLLKRLEHLQSERDMLLSRSQEIEERVREYLARNGGKFT